MKVQLLELVVLAFIIKMDLFSQASLWSPQSQTETDVYLQGYTLESFKSNTILECYDKCEKDSRCYSINIDLSDLTCELKSSTIVKRPDDRVPRGNVIYMEIREHIIPGDSPAHPIASCKSLNTTENSKSGVYWLKLDANSPPVKVYCEMDIDGGGWTLVYSYAFTAYSSFSQVKNAVTPRPNWVLNQPNRYIHTPISTTIPLNKSAESAMDFSLWKLIGSGVLVTSDINDWYSCTDGGDRLPKGSVVNWVTGSLTCKRVKEVVPRSSFTCTPAIPNWFIYLTCTALLKHNDNINYSWNSEKTVCYPCHDPCGTITTESRHHRGVVNPHGQIYIR